ncbi:11998_t:CDS:2, partial [Gigaspora margarita]
KEDMTFSRPSDDLLDRCGGGVRNKEDTTFSCPSDDLLDRYVPYYYFAFIEYYIKWVLETEDKENPAGSSYKRQRTEGENMEHSDNKNFFNTVKYDDNENELEKQTEQTIQYDGKIWIVTKINVYITPGTNGDFIRSMPNDAMHEIMLFGSTEQQSVTENVKELIVKFIKLLDSVDESYNETRQNDILKFVWGFVNLLADSFERENDLADFDLSELAYREIFLAPAIRSFCDVYPCSGEKHLFASSEELNLKKTDKESRDIGNKVDIIWSLKLTDLEFCIGEVSGPPNKRDHTHFFGDKLGC